jgi:hypothetical protein
MGPAIAADLMAICIRLKLMDPGVCLGIDSWPYWGAIAASNSCLVGLNADVCSKRVGSWKVFCILQANRATNCKMVLTTLVAPDERHSLGIGIKGLADDVPFWDTNAFVPKWKLSTLTLPELIFQPFSMI